MLSVLPVPLHIVRRYAVHVKKEGQGEVERFDLPNLSALLRLEIDMTGSELR